MSVLIPVGEHLFASTALQKYVEEAAAALKPGSAGVVKAAVDADGVKVVLVLATNQTNLKLVTAVAHDWTGDTTFSVGGSFSF